MILALFGIVASMLIIWRACDAFEAATSYLGRNLSDGVKGATFNAIGSSLPELLTASAALLFYANKDGFAFGIGTTAGSAIFNSAVIPAMVILTVVVFAGITNSIIISKKVVIRDGISLIAIETALIWMLADGIMTTVEGWILMGMYGLYVIILFSTMGKGEPEEFDDVTEHGNNRLLSLFTLNLRNLCIGSRDLTGKTSWLLLLAATIVIGGACHILVESCYVLGEEMGIRTYFIAVILAAAATSVPDTIISIKDAKAGNYDDAVSNALGSNIFDICVCLGLPLVVYGMMTGESIQMGSDQGSVAELRVLLLMLTGFIFFLLLIGKGIGKIKGVLMLLSYCSFVGYITLRAYENETAITIGGYLQNILKLIGG